jgi:hypothetical protein
VESVVVTLREKRMTVLHIMLVVVLCVTASFVCALSSKARTGSFWGKGGRPPYPEKWDLWLEKFYDRHK